MAFCTSCGRQIEDGLQYCTFCGAYLSNTTPAPQPTPQPVPQRRRHVGAIVATILVVTALVTAGVVGYFNDWYGIPDLIEKAQGGNPGGSDPDGDDGQGSEAGIGDAPGGEATPATGTGGIVIRPSVDSYSWDELSQISRQISTATSSSEAMRVASEYNLCGPNGELSSMPSKSITLSNGTQLHARIIGFNHDDRSDGSGKAGLTFLFDEAVALSPWNSSGLNDGGWQASTIRSWLSMTFLDTLPDDLASGILEVNKASNNVGGVDSGTLGTDVVGVTADKLWVPSHIELAGNDPEDTRWPEWRSGSEYYWCNDIISSEGSCYSLFEELATNGSTSNDVLIRRYEGTAQKWWMRSTNPHFSFVTLTVSETGALDGDVGSIESLGIVPGFCV